MSRAVVETVRRRRPDVRPLLLAGSGWAALAATALPAANPLRVAAVAVFLLGCPGAALLRLARPALRPGEWWSTVVLAVAASAALTALTTETLYLARQFTAARVVLALAVLTTALTLPALRHPRPPTGPPGGEPGDEPGRQAGREPPARRPARRPGRRPGRGRIWTAAALLTATAACGGPAVGGMQDQGAPAPTGLPATEPSARPPAGPHPWHPVFQDDFTGRTLNPANWTTCYDWNQDGCTNAGNRESEWYRPGQVSVAEGALTLTAQRRPTTGSDGKTHPWTSGMVSTGRDSWNAPPRHTFTYGYVAAAVQAPADPTGMFPAFWLLPAATRGGLPEIDVAEFINSNRYVDLNLHTTTPRGRDTVAHQHYGPADFAGGYHVLAVDWEPDGITWYVDGTPRFQVTDPAQIPNTPMELLINLAVGFEQAPPAGTDSAQLHVAWVGVWQH
ncbi:glycoside hydrolase family 16 protein [Kitasatospora sp. NPDC004272]